MLPDSDQPHPSHDLRGSDAGSFDEICKKCGRTDITGGGWGDLVNPCPVIEYGLVDKDHGALKLEVPYFDFEEPPIDPVEFAYSLVHTMMAKKGLGLAANQLGFPYRVFVMKAQPFIVCFNPLIVNMSTEQILLDEGCLTFPGLFIKIKRSEMIKVRYTEPNGEVQNKTYSGMSARIFQHELDHLNGIVFLDVATRYHKDQAFNQKRKRERNVIKT